MGGRTVSVSQHLSDCSEAVLTLTRPESTTYLMLSIVTDASATFVLMMTLRVRGGGGSKTAICSSVDKPECSGRALRSAAPFGNLRELCISAGQV